MYSAALERGTDVFTLLHPEQQIHNQLNGTSKAAKHFHADLDTLKSLIQHGRISSTVISKDDHAYTMLGWLAEIFSTQDQNPAQTATT